MNNCLECKKLTGGLCEKCFKEQENNIMKQDIENIIKKWLKKHKDDGQWVSDYDGEFDLENCCLDGDFDLNDLADEVLKVVVEKIEFKYKLHIYKFDEEDCRLISNGEQCDVCSYNKALDDIVKLLTNSSTLEGEQSPNKENK